MLKPVIFALVLALVGAILFPLIGFLARSRYSTSLIRDAELQATAAAAR